MRVTRLFEFAQGREPAERQMGFSRQALSLFVIILSARDRMSDEWADEILA